MSSEELSPGGVVQGEDVGALTILHVQTFEFINTCIYNTVIYKVHVDLSLVGVFIENLVRGSAHFMVYGLQQGIEHF